MLFDNIVRVRIWPAGGGGKRKIHAFAKSMTENGLCDFVRWKFSYDFLRHSSHAPGDCGSADWRTISHTYSCPGPGMDRIGPRLTLQVFQVRDRAPHHQQGQGL